MNSSSNTKRTIPVKPILAISIAGSLALFAWLLFRLPDPSVFNANVERIFVETDLSSQADIKLLEVLAASGSLFESSLNLYREIILTLLVLSITLVVTSIGLLLANLSIRQQFNELKTRALNPLSIELLREQNLVRINEDNFTLTKGNIETLALFMEARQDSEYLSGVQIESMISGKPLSECDEASGVMRIKRLRDNLGNQLVSDLLVRHIPVKGYLLDVDTEALTLK